MPSTVSIDHYARVGKKYQREPLGLANDAFSNPAGRMGWGTPSVPEATEYPLVRLSNNYWLMVSLYRNHWICRRIVRRPRARYGAGMAETQKRDIAE